VRNQGSKATAEAELRREGLSSGRNPRPQPHCQSAVKPLPWRCCSRCPMTRSNRYSAKMTEGGQDVRASWGMFCHWGCSMKPFNEPSSQLRYLMRAESRRAAVREVAYLPNEADPELEKIEARSQMETNIMRLCLDYPHGYSLLSSCPPAPTRTVAANVKCKICL
jgi:hypothetical protein